MFFTFSAFAEVLNDFTSICGVSGYHRMYAVPKSFTCLPGQFLPANAIVCYNCPDGYTCTGGTYTFNSTTAQGLILNGYVSSDTNNTCAINTGHKMNGRYVQNVHDCTPGYYLPANVDECVQCLSSHYCRGGRWTFNPTTTQGTEDCSSGQNSACDGYLSTAELYLDDNNTIKKINVVQNSPMPSTDNNGDMLTPPTRPGYTFKGYYSAPTGGVKYYNADMTSAHVWDLVEEE